ncbi:TRAP transporter permease [Alkalilimnicola sp. S0819]|uniref:TRAP transporter permease n=1 Tax=Alkalilimnicola sp. S0819 TaxID=2613922 RepID=UPI001262801F|nr:TRAP transporter fused permease subunit [Alkalilimnicola sp. S0819]KAB7623324.1 TRAP transporter fused permease subunit [Alkalilimnicola sp. S0819]MPQ16862.1 TRAP transporter fused permease subunit [Alkalilimnicola sp. S0819]
MSNEHQAEKWSARRRLLAGLLALAMALFGLANALPTYGGLLPRIGPFQTELLRAVMFAAAVLIVLLLKPFSVHWRGRRFGFAAGLLLDGALAVTALVTLWQFYQVMARLNTGLFFFETHHAWTALAGAAVFIILCWREWGAALPLFALLCLLYLLTGQYWPGPLQTAPLDFLSDVPGDLWFNLGKGILGTIAGIILLTVFPFILLGGMLEGTGAGMSLIKASYNLMRRFRGGPAHAAIAASSLFGAMSGGAVANVVGTGVLTIPAIVRRGFKPSFAGGVEASASAGGQLMPPIMGAAALVMADFTGVSYLTIIVAALLPALAYYASLFIAVMFEARKLGVEVADAGELDRQMRMAPQDWVNLVLVVLPVAALIAALLKGMSAAGAGITALLVLVAASPLNPAIRRQPWRLLAALAEGGCNFAKLLLAVGVIGVITAVLGTTNLPGQVAQLIGGAADQMLLLTLIMAAFASLLLGMGMPTLPAYLTIILILGPSLQSFGLAALTAHMFVFYYGVASNITPPVALASYAAAAIARASPFATAVTATRIGAVVFVIPFMFAFNPELLIVGEAGGEASAWELVAVILRTLGLIYLLSSAATAYDVRPLAGPERLLRVVLALALITPLAWLHWSAWLTGLACLLLHRLSGHRAGRRKPSLEPGES